MAADGWVMAPYFVAPGVVHFERWYTVQWWHTLGGIMITVSSSGYSSDQLAVGLHFFQKQTQDRARDRQRLLLFEGHGSHLTG